MPIKYKKSLIKEVVTYLHHYDNPEATETGVEAGLNRWAANKEKQLEWMKKSPYYNGNFQLIIPASLDGTAKTEIMKGCVDLALLTPITAEQKVFFKWFKEHMDTTVTEEIRAKIIETFPELEHSISIGLKISKAFKRICDSTVIKEHPLYAKMFSFFADASNPVHNEKTIVISIHPIDYLGMSLGYFTSCHNIATHGCCAGGTLSYLGDKYSLVVYTVKDSDLKSEEPINFLASFHTYGNDYRGSAPAPKGRYEYCPKEMRQMFFIDTDRDIILQSRAYNPFNCDNFFKLIRDNVERVYTEAQCRDNNLWKSYAKKDIISEYVTTGSYNAAYPDWNYSHGGNYYDEDICITFRSGTEEYEKVKNNNFNHIKPMIVGGPRISIKTGLEIHSTYGEELA